MIHEHAFDERMDNLLIAFDEMGFVPTMLTPDPKKTAKEWKENLIAVITELYKMNDCLNKRVMELEQEVIHADEKVFYREEEVDAAWDNLKSEKKKFEAEKVWWSTECVKRLKAKGIAIQDKEHADNINVAVKVFANVIMGRLQEVCPMDASCKITLFDAIGIVLDALKEYKE